MSLPSPEQIALIFLAIAAAALITTVVLFLISRRLRVRLTADELYKTKTPDGWTIALARWRPAAQDARRLPVILCHGLGATAGEFDLAEHISLARFLRARGFDVWAVDLRGRADAAPPPGTGYYAFSMDHHIEHDVPAAIDFVKQETGAARVAWVGHSMGGIVIYAHAETRASDLACAVTIGSPAGVSKKPRVAQLSPLLKLVPTSALHAQFFSRLLAVLAGRINPPTIRLLLNPENAEGWVIRRGMASCLCDIPVGCLKQLDGWMRSGRLVSGDGKRVYFERLADVKTPWLAIGGAADKLVPWPNARAGFDMLGSAEKRWILAGKEQGHAADYGHCDLVMGPRAAQDVFAPIAEFLEKHARVAPAVEAAV